MAVAFGIIKLFPFQGPEKRNQPYPAKDKRNRDKEDQDIHLRCNLKAFSDTVIDEADIANAAAKGVANPASAIGIATRL